MRISVEEIGAVKSTFGILTYFWVIGMLFLVCENAGVTDLLKPRDHTHKL